MTNTGTIEVAGDSTLVLSGETVTNSVTVADVTTNGIIQVDATSTLDLEGATVNGGTLTISGLLDSTGDSFINDAAITNSGIIDVTSGIGTISGASSFINNGTLETLGAELDLVNTTVTNNGSIIVDLAEGLSGTLNLQGATINGGTINVFGVMDFDRHQLHHRCGDRQLRQH